MEFSFRSRVKEAQAFESGSSHTGGPENFLRAGQSQCTGQLRCLTLKDEKQREREHVGRGASGGCGMGWPMITLGQTQLKGHEQGRTAG